MLVIEVKYQSRCQQKISDLEDCHHEEHDDSD